MLVQRLKRSRHDSPLDTHQRLGHGEAKIKECTARLDDREDDRMSSDYPTAFHRYHSVVKGNTV